MSRSLCLSFKSSCVVAVLLGAATLVGCAGSEPAGNPSGAAGASSPGSGGTTGAAGDTGGNSQGGSIGSGGSPGAGGSSSGSAGSGNSSGSAGSGPGGTTGAGGSTVGSGGSTGAGATGGAVGAGGSSAGRGGASGSGGAIGTAGRGGSTGAAGTVGGRGGNGGSTGAAGTTAGRGGSTGAAGTGGATGTGGTTGTGGATTVDCAAALPSGGTAHMSTNAQGTAAGMNWSIWSNQGAGTITTFSTPAFSASWGGSGDFLARIGLSFGNSGKAVSALGTVTANYTETKSGNAGGYSYVGIYGWSINPCIEWYIVDDSFNNLPFNPGGTSKGTATIDGGTYNLILRSTTGTGGNRCGSSVTQWNQFYSVRTKNRTCGTISISDHFAAWAAQQMTLGSVLEASILIEAGGGTGSIQFPVATVTSTP